MLTLKLVKNEVGAYVSPIETNLRLVECGQTEIRSGQQPQPAATAWLESLGDTLDPGQYYVVVTFEDGSGRVIPFVVEPPTKVTIRAGLL